MFSFVICVFGMLLFSLGYLLRYEHQNIFEDLFTKASVKTKSALEKIPMFFPEKYRLIKIPESDVNVFADQISIAFLVIGAICLFISIFACNVTKNSKRLRVIIYTVLLIALTLAMVGAYTHGIYLVIKDMKISLDNYSGLADHSPNGMTWNVIMIGLDCCGVDNYTDFKKTKEVTKKKNWPPRDPEGYTFNATLLWAFLGISNLPLPTLRQITENELSCNFVVNGGYNVRCTWLDAENFKTPMACCKSLADLVHQCHTTANATEENNWMGCGCGQRVSDYLFSNQTLVIIFVSVTAFMAAYSLLMVIRVIVGDGASEHKH